MVNRELPLSLAWPYSRDYPYQGGWCHRLVGSAECANIEKTPGSNRNNPPVWVCIVDELILGLLIRDGWDRALDVPFRPVTLPSRRSTSAILVHTPYMLHDSSFDPLSVAVGARIFCSCLNRPEYMRPWGCGGNYLVGCTGSSVAIDSEDFNWPKKIAQPEEDSNAFGYFRDHL